MDGTLREIALALVVLMTTFAGVPVLPTIETPPIQVPAIRTDIKGTDRLRDATRYASEDLDFLVTNTPVAHSNIM